MSNRTLSLDARLAAGEGGRYDFAFIDADKGGYHAYYDRLLADQRIDLSLVPIGDGLTLARRRI